MTTTILGQEAMIASTLTKREFTPHLTLTVVLVATIAITAHLASTNTIRSLAGDKVVAAPPHLSLIGKSRLKGLQQGEINKPKLQEKLLTAIYKNQKMKIESYKSLKSSRGRKR
jgi:hypothetical protein